MVEVDTTGLEKSISSVSDIGRQATVGIIVVGQLIGTAIVMAILLQPSLTQFQGVAYIAMIAFAVTLIVSFVVLFRVFFAREATTCRRSAIVERSARRRRDCGARRSGAPISGSRRAPVESTGRAATSRQAATSPLAGHRRRWRWRRRVVTRSALRSSTDGLVSTTCRPPRPAAAAALAVLHDLVPASVAVLERA